MAVNILHISDLHRSCDHPLKNGPLLHSLKIDNDRYSKQSPICMDLIIVSGDIVLGSELNGEEALEEIKIQYDEAKDFLISLANDFLSGDRRRIIIVPGNHDITWHYSMSSMQKMVLSRPRSPEIKKLVKSLLISTSGVRFSWDDLSFYKIDNLKAYNDRMKLFCNFYEDFYDHERKYSLDPELQFDIFNYNEFNLTILGLNSCYLNDHLNREGKINPTCISKAATILKNVYPKNNKLLCVWHHNTSGAPSQNDYIDPIILENLTEMGVELAFHGHQHYNQVVSQFSKIFSEKKMYLVSAPSLCAGATELPPGHKRGYNLVELDWERAMMQIKTREMKPSSFEAPIWGEAFVDGYNKPIVELQLKDVTMLKRNIILDLAEVEALIRGNQYEYAFLKLKDIPNDNQFKRPMLFKVMRELNMETEISEIFFPPLNTEEALFLLDTFWDAKNVEKIKYLVENEPLSTTEDMVVKTIVEDYRTRAEILFKRS